MSKIIYILGGGTFNHVRNHLSIAAPAFGETARKLDTMFKEQLQEQGLTDEYSVKLVLTKMADHTSKLVTNADVSNYVDTLIADPNTKAIIFNVAMADFEGSIDGVPSGKHAERIQSRNSEVTMNLVPSDKVIGKIRKSRKDIFAVGFKTTCNQPREVQYLRGLKLMKENSLNLVLANDTGTYENMIVVPEESNYKAADRDGALKLLVKMTLSRMQDKFTRSEVVPGESVDWNGNLVPENLRKVVNHCIVEGAYKPFLGKTVGHFAVKVKDGVILTSKRKTNFNELDKIGLVKIESVGDDKVIAHGAKPSVGGQSQRIIFSEHPELDCIAHFHSPVREEFKHTVVPVREQWPHECGSHQCGKNTSDGLREVDLGGGDFLKVVYLDEHGPNIVFNRNTNADKIIDFIDKTFDLKAKTGGLVDYAM